MARIFELLLTHKRFYSGSSSNLKAQKYVLTKYFQGEPKKSDFKIVEEAIPELKDGGETEIIILNASCFRTFCI